MKILLLPVLIFGTILSYGQDNQKIKQIDSLVKVINESNMTIQHDSVSQNYPEMSIKNYITLAIDGNKLKKYVDKGNSTRQENGKTIEMITSTAFFYDQDKLIKVEEFAMGGDKEMHMDWYFSDEKLLHATFQSEKAESRANLLLTLSKGVLKQVQDKIK